MSDDLSGKGEWFKGPKKEEYSATKNSGLSDQGRRLFGTPDVPASKPYFCQRCQAQVLTQDAEWQADGKPHCPHCGAVLKEAK